MSKTQIDITLHPKQGEALAALQDKEILGYGGARGGGKSHLVRAYLMLRALKYPGSRHLIVRKSYPELQRNHIDRFASDYGSVLHYVERKHRFETPNNSQIECGYCEGESDLQRYQGGEYDTVCIDEAQFHSKKIFQYLRACLRTTGSIRPKMILTFNPGGIGHAWLKAAFIDNMYDPGEDPDHYGFVKALVYDNPSIVENDPDYIKRLEALPEPTRSAMLNGDFSVFEGQFFRVSPKSIVAPFEIGEDDARDNLYGSLDHGIAHNTSFGLWYHDKRNKRFIRLFSYLNNGGTAATHAEEIHNRIEAFHWTHGHMPKMIWADPSMWTKQALNAYTFRSFIDEYIERFGSATRFEKANNDKVNGCAILRQLLTESDGQPTIYYFARYNTTWVEQLGSVMTDANNRDIYVKMDGDDTADETRYGAVGLYSIAKTEASASQMHRRVQDLMSRRKDLKWELV